MNDTDKWLGGTGRGRGLSQDSTTGAPDQHRGHRLGKVHRDVVLKKQVDGEVTAWEILRAIEEVRATMPCWSVPRQRSRLPRPPGWAVETATDVFTAGWRAAHRSLLDRLPQADDGEAGEDAVNCARLAHFGRALLAAAGPGRGAVEYSLRSMATVYGRNTIQTLAGFGLVAVDEHTVRTALRASSLESLASVVREQIPGVRDVHVAATGVRLLGVYACLAKPSPLSTCVCLRDLADDLGRQALGVILAAALPPTG